MVVNTRRNTTTARSLFISLAGILAAVTFLAVGAPVASAQVVGGIDMVSACAAAHGGDQWWAPEVVSHDAFGWRCFNDQLRARDNGVDMNWACRGQFGPNASARALNVHDPSSWVCEVPNG
jgi:hypothetical protein